MKQKTGHNIQRKIANFFGAFGYVLCFLQWFWAIILYFSVIQPMILLMSPNTSQQVDQPQNITIAPPSTTDMIIAAITVAVMIAITIYVLVRIPVSIAKTGNKVVHRTAETMTPVVIKAQHKQDTKKIRAKITTRLSVVIKSLLVIIPVVFTAASRLLEEQSIDYSIAMTVGGALACLSLVFFAIQYMLAGLFSVKLSELR